MKKILFFTAALSAATAFGAPVDLIHCEFSRTPLFEYVENEIQAKSSASGNPMELKRTAEGWLFTIPRDGRSGNLPLPHGNWKCSRPEAVVFRVKTLKGRAFVRLNMLDGNGRWFKTAGQWFTPESDRVVFPLDGMPQGGGWCRIVSMQIDSEPDTQFVLKRIERTFDRPESEALQIAPDTGDGMLPVFAKSPKFIIRNASANPVKREARFTFTGMDGAEYTVSREVDLPPYSEVKFAPENLPPHNGVWYGKPETDGQRVMFAVYPENGLAVPENPEFEFAIDNHWINPAVVEAMRYMGIRAIRTIVGWERIQPNSGKDWNFQVFEARYNALNNAGIRMRDTLVFTPGWAATDNPAKLRYPRNRKPRMEAWENYVRAMLSRYGDKVEFFEVWNEPDLPGFVDFPVEDYIELCRAVRRIAKEVSPNAKIASGGFATFSPTLLNGRPGKFHETVLRNAKDTFDIHSHHEHGYFPHYQRMIDGYLLPLRKKHNITQPWLASETAVHSAKGTDIEQADCLFKKLLFTWARGGFSYTWYGLCNNGYDLSRSEDNFGVFDRFMNPKYIFGVYAALIRDYREAKYVSQLQVSGKPWLFSFKCPDSMLLANWSLNPQGGTALYAAYSDAASEALKLDLEGTASQLPLENGIAVFPVSPMGSTLQLKGAANISKVEPVASLKLPNAVILGTAASGKLILRNPWTQTVSCAISPKLNDDNRVTGLPVSISLAPGETVTREFKLYCNSAVNSIPIELKFGGHVPVEVLVPLRVASLIPDAKFDKRKPDFVLNKYAQMECVFEFDPAIADTLWSGSEDLSAKIWLGRNNDKLEVVAEVIDNNHCTTPKAEHLWLGDSVQFALDFTGQNGHFELGGGLNAAGKPVPDCWIVPQGFSIAAVRNALDVKIAQQGNRLTYRFSIPLAALGVTKEKLANGFRFNLLVNDNDDGKKRKCFLRIAHGIGSTQSMTQAPMVICR